MIIKKIIFSIFLALSLASILESAIYLKNSLSSRKGLVLEGGEPIGGDFMAFYIAGRMLNENPHELYNLELQWNIQRELFPESPRIANSPLPFVYPPLVALPFKYLSRLSFVDAYLAWMVIGLLFYISAIIVFCYALHVNLFSVLLISILALGFTPFIGLALISGQSSALGVMIVAFLYATLKIGKPRLAGLILSLSYYKPPLFIIFVFVALLQKRWHLMQGFVFGAVILTSVSFWLVGSDSMVLCFRHLMNYKFGSQVNPGIIFVPKFGAGLLAFVAAFCPADYTFARIIYLVLAAALLCLFYPYLKYPGDNQRAELFNLVFAKQMILSLLLSLHMVNYDVSLYIVPIILTGMFLWNQVISFYSVSTSLLLLVIYNEYLFREVLIFGASVNIIVLFVIGWLICLAYAIKQIIRKSCRED